MFPLFCSKFIQETVYQTSSESPEFYRRYYKKHFGLVFLDTPYMQWVNYMMMMTMMMIMKWLLTAGKALSRTVTLRQAKQPSDASSLQVTELIQSQGEAFKIERHRTTAEWYPRPLYEWKTGRMHDKDQKTFVLSSRVQLDSDTGMLDSTGTGTLYRYARQYRYRYTIQVW